MIKIWHNIVDNALDIEFLGRDVLRHDTIYLAHKLFIIWWLTYNIVYYCFSSPATDACGKVISYMYIWFVFSFTMYNPGILFWLKLIVLKKINIISNVWLLIYDIRSFYIQEVFKVHWPQFLHRSLSGLFE